MVTEGICTTGIRKDGVCGLSQEPCGKRDL